jgi:hypothetical protein
MTKPKRELNSPRMTAIARLYCILLGGAIVALVGRT